jgi:hypothetical protein
MVRPLPSHGRASKGSRQQLLATILMLGINCIVVTDGKISANVNYDFKAQNK